MVVALSIACAGCRTVGESSSHPEEDAALAAPPTLSLSGEALTSAAKVDASDDVRVLDGPRPFDARSFAIVLRGAPASRSPSIEALLFRDRIVERIELPTSGLFAPSWLDASAIPATIDARADDVDGDGQPELVVRATYHTEPRCAHATVGVEQLVVVAIDPVARIVASVQLRYEPDSRAVGSRRSNAAWEGGALIVRGEECDARTKDAGAATCTPFTETYARDRETRTWLRGLAPKRASALELPCKQ
jgi:hypothetical protein